jgi:hypothetical protein
MLQGLTLQHPTRFVSPLRGVLFYSVNSSCSRARIPSNGLAALPSTPYLDPENGKLFPTEGRRPREVYYTNSYVYALRNCLSALGLWPLCSSFPHHAERTGDRFVYPFFSTRVLLSEELSLHLRNFKSAHFTARASSLPSKKILQPIYAATPADVTNAAPSGLPDR